MAAEGKGLCWACIMARVMNTAHHIRRHGFAHIVNRIRGTRGVRGAGAAATSDEGRQRRRNGPLKARARQTPNRRGPRPVTCARSGTPVRIMCRRWVRRPQGERRLCGASYLGKVRVL